MGEIFTHGSVLLAWSVAAGSLCLIAMLLLVGRKSREDHRLSELSSSGPRASGAPAAPRAPIQSRAATELERRQKDEEKKNQLRQRIIQAGLYHHNAVALFALLRIVFMLSPVGLGFALGSMGIVSMTPALLIGATAGLAGTLAPSFWLDYVKASRQRNVRRALPDALDVISVCLEGGMSLASALSRVARELATAHPMLALELAIVERETQMGRSTGDSMREFARRVDLEELRSLASVIIQAERFGSSLTHAMHVYAETLRLKRHQRAEELAQKAAVKIIFPTLFCIFPGIFIVILGPAAIQIMTTLNSLTKNF
jgi:tight adherence protein C